MTSGTDSKPEDKDRGRYKVGRIIEEYSLGDLDTELPRLWTGDGEQQASLRELADYVNKRILQTEMERADVRTIDGEVKNTYRLLTDSDVSSGVRTRARRSLEREGVDVDEVEQDFVTHQAIHTYLTKYLDVQQEHDEQDRVKRDIETVRRLQSRARAVTEGTVDRLQSQDHVSISNPNVIVDINIVCEDCGTRYTVDDLADSGSCECIERD